MCAESGLEFFAILEDVLASVPVGEAEIEDVSAVEVGDAAGGRAEAVEEPREFGEDVQLKNSLPADGA